jgi:SAM-dependent methyltransferase
MRRWVQLARVVKTGRPAERTPSIRGEEGDAEAFIGAMDNVSAPVADAVVGDLEDLRYRHVLDVGGASGTWTIAFLRRSPDARATIFDLPHVMPMARQRLADAGLLDRVDLRAGDFAVDPLPTGADLAWVSAIVHMNSRAENRALFGKVKDSLVPGGTIAIRDIVMEPSRVEPPAGALFAVNMLVGTDGGGTFTLDELREDLEAGGLCQVRLARRDPGMSSVVLADSPGEP